jgi:molecular chaperone GrpE
VTDRERAQGFRITDKRRFSGDAAPADRAGAASAPSDQQDTAPAPSDQPGAGVAPSDGHTPAPEEADASTPERESRNDGTGPTDPADIERLRAQAEEYLAHLQRLQAEFDNYRKRVLKEQTRAVEHAAEPVMRRLLEVMDDFELALMAAEQQPDFDKFLKGVELVYAKLADALRAEGLERIQAEGAPFDPESHEALLQTGDGDGEPIVADVLRPGYTLRGRVIRPAGVRVERDRG